MPPITIHPTPYTYPDATTLRAAQQLEMANLRSTGFGVPATSANVPVFLVAYDGPEPIGCGGLRLLAERGLPGQAEVKRSDFGDIGKDCEGEGVEGVEGADQ
ncbi:hypothetical protein MBLNU13_g04192t1 [Cladosporium sp. NU13]